MALLAAAVPVAAGAQESAAEVSPAPLCTIAEKSSERGAIDAVIAICGTQGVWLGRADKVELIENRVIGATLVDLRRGFTRRILMITTVEGHAPLVDDVTGQLARAAGRGPLSGLEGVRLDLGRFATEGSIGVAAERIAATGDLKNPLARAAETVSAEVSLVRLASLGRSLRQGLPVGEEK